MSDPDPHLQMVRGEGAARQSVCDVRYQVVPTEGRMSDTDPLPRPPRRRINGVTWVWETYSHCYECCVVVGWHNGICKHLGYAMGCVKDDDGQLPDRFTEEAG
jgi:hypothetical protein